METDDLRFDLVASELRADSDDLTLYATVLAGKLSGALPAQTEVRYTGGGLLGGPKHVAGIAVTLGEMRYELSQRKRGLTCRRARIVRGIAIKTEELDLAEWIDALSRDLTAEAQRGEQARLALARLLGT